MQARNLVQLYFKFLQFSFNETSFIFLMLVSMYLY